MRVLQSVVSVVAATMFLCGVTFGQMPQATKEHKILKKEEGTWNATMKIHVDMAGNPIPEPMVMKGKETNRMLGDLWIVSDFEGDFGGMAFKGHGVFGYDAKAKRYSGSWVDSMTPTVSHMSGTYDAEKKTMTYETRGMGPDGKPMLGKNVVVYTDKDNRKNDDVHPKAGHERNDEVNGNHLYACKVTE